MSHPVTALNRRPRNQLISEVGLQRVGQAQRNVLELPA